MKILSMAMFATFLVENGQPLDGRRFWDVGAACMRCQDLDHNEVPELSDLCRYMESSRWTTSS